MEGKSNNREKLEIGYAKCRTSNRLLQALIIKYMHQVQEVHKDNALEGATIFDKQELNLLQALSNESTKLFQDKEEA